MAKVILVQKQFPSKTDSLRSKYVRKDTDIFKDNVLYIQCIIPIDYSRNLMPQYVKDKGNWPKLDTHDLWCTDDITAVLHQDFTNATKNCPVQTRSLTLTLSREALTSLGIKEQSIFHFLGRYVPKTNQKDHTDCYQQQVSTLWRQH